MSGSHKSPFQGISVEFAEHREYVPGDDVRHVDWKVFGKTDKFYLKQYEQETNLVCNLLLDVSESMRYGSGETSKLEFASRLVASLAYLIVHRADSVGLALFEDRLHKFLPPASQATHLKQLLTLLATCEPGKEASRVGDVLGEMAGRLTKRSLIMVVSDCFDDIDRIVAGIKHLRYKRHEIVFFHVLDPAELDFPFDQITLFKGLEALPDVLAEPRALRNAYLAEFNEYLKELRLACRANDVDYQLMRTDQPLDLALAGYLASRSARSA
ncbi:DUF58 domain-containing protein [Kolteria novifilia]|uniref:DUF58 domain-containing protein n=1 Tax=Kolteria novifilia TaxID=2527975 RepID=UPI003AF397D8